MSLATEDQAKLDDELREMGGCSESCSPHLLGYTAFPECYIVATEHAGYKVPFRIKRLPDQDSPDNVTFAALIYYWQEATPGWHANPGSEDDWRARFEGKR